MNWQVIVIAAICVVLFGGYNLITKRDETVATAAVQVPQPGFYMKDAVIVEIGIDGKPRFTLHAENIAQDKTHQYVQLEHVNVNYMGSSTTPWVLTSDHGNLEQNTRLVTFSGNVILQPQGSRITMPIILNTDELNIDTEHSVAHAPGKVSITMDKQLLTAVGLQANLQRQTIRLESQVHGEFASR